MATPEMIRLRPGMYVGPTDNRGIRNLLWEVVANSIDEHLADRCSHIRVEIGTDGSISVEDTTPSLNKSVRSSTVSSLAET